MSRESETPGGSGWLAWDGDLTVCHFIEVDWLKAVSELPVQELCA